jgi:hypothetical protein
MRPSRLICAAPCGPYGPATAATSGMAATCRSTPAAFEPVPGTENELS